MGTLRHVTTGETTPLEPEHLIGRRPRSDTTISESYVSVEHASIRWGSNGWEVRDLDSLNGTLVNGQRIRPRRALRLRRGDRLTIARSEQTWELVDDSPPRVMVVALARPQAPIFIDGDILALPSDEEPRATVFRDADGAWHLEREDEVVRLPHHAVFETAGHAYRFSCPDVVQETSTVDWRERLGNELTRACLVFRVSRDEEHVELQLERETGERLDLGSRTFNYALLLLARNRMADAAQGVQESSAGWMYQDDLIDALKISSDRLNIDIFRIRSHFAATGVLDAAKIVERRPRSRQLRIGIGTLAIETI